VLEGVVFNASPTNTVGAKLPRLKDGDKVTVVYEEDVGQGREPINAMILKKVQ
jgi:hypothetical protein